MPRTLVRFQEIRVLSGYTVMLFLTDGTTREVDLSRYFHGPVFDRIRTDAAYFKTIHIDPVAGTVVWDNGADIDPDVLIKGLTPAWMEETAAK
ncbi:MAG: DUF2442 domain-containing protein [Chitinivibrionales bacterium]|nr:DUF2442 domain-containing protein [Chitinivibrionales bacterium]